MLWVAILFTASIYFVCGVKKIPPGQRGVVVRRRRRSARALGPGLVWIPPIFSKIERISVDPFSVSLPPQSAITSDEIPIQIQSNFDAEVFDANTAVRVRDWRAFLVSELQYLLKTGMEELSFDSLDKEFPDWTKRIRNQLDQKAEEVGAKITALQISNLSPRSKPA